MIHTAHTHCGSIVYIQRDGGLEPGHPLKNWRSPVQSRSDVDYSEFVVQPEC